jgi:alpha-beta hydrolase superfamily lysophospholipase
MQVSDRVEVVLDDSSILNGKGIMDHNKFRLKASDGMELFAQRWVPEREPVVGVVCAIHGLGEHSGRYNHLADVLGQAGYVTMAIDLHGHGRSPGKRGHVSSYQRMLDDITLLLDDAQKWHPDIPLFLYGHSMGGGLVLNYALRRDAPLAGVIATGPALRLGFEPPPLQVALTKMMNAIWPAFTQTSGLDAQALSRDPKVIQRYQADPLVHDQISASLFNGIYQAGLWALEHADAFPTPLLLMHGNEDRLTSPDASREFANRVGDGCTFKLWEGLYHEIHNEPEQDQVFAFLLGWLRHQVEQEK